MQASSFHLLHRLMGLAALLSIACGDTAAPPVDVRDLGAADQPGADQAPDVDRRPDLARTDVGHWPIPNPTEHFTVDRWLGGAEAAISFTLDEGFKEPYAILMPELKRRGWFLTFFVYTEQPYETGAWDLIREAHRVGHEVANHTLKHPDLTGLSANQIDAELRGGIKDLQKHLGFGLDLHSFSYPYERTNPLVWAQVSRYHRYARGGAGAVGAITVDGTSLNDAFAPNWGDLAANANLQSVTQKRWNGWVDTAIKAKAWLIEELHGVCEKQTCGGWEPRTLVEFQNHFDHIETFADRAWVAPMRVVGNYIERRNSAFFVIRNWSPGGVEFLVVDRFDAAQLSLSDYYQVPLSFVLQVPATWGWTSATLDAAEHQQSVEALGEGRFRITVEPDPNRSVVIRPRS